MSYRTESDRYRAALKVWKNPNSFVKPILTRSEIDVVLRERREKELDESILKCVKAKFNWHCPACNALEYDCGSEWCAGPWQLYRQLKNVLQPYEVVTVQAEDKQ